MITCFFENGQQARGEGLRHVTTDVMLVDERRERVLLVKRSEQMTAEPGKWALPGGFLDRDEEIETAARRGLREETGYVPAGKMEWLGIEDDPARDERQNVAVLWRAVAGEQVDEPDTESAAIEWWPVNELPPAEEMAFDHRKLIEKYGRSDGGMEQTGGVGRVSETSQVRQDGQEVQLGQFGQTGQPGQPVLLYLGIKAVITRGEGKEQEVLLLKAVSKAVAGGWRWDLPGGRINGGEVEVGEVLRREMAEELGLNQVEVMEETEIGECLGVQVVPRPTLRVPLALCFYEVKLARELEGKNFQLSEEHLTWEWRRVSEVGELKNSDGGATDWAVFLAKTLSAGNFHR